ncbi:MAG: multicopper oxidase family protein [Hyphomicrobiales bacterium]|nr:multicopper oxidase family protein [Hyphomicrobiales bacterium]
MSRLLSRRGFLASAAAASAGGILVPRLGLGQLADPSSLPIETSLNPCSLPKLTVERRTIEVNGKAASVFGITAPNGSSGLVLDADQRFLFDLVNRSGEATIIHWHGQTPPTDQDGVVETGYEGPIEDGESHVYDFATRPGTHWMHSHFGLQEQALLAAPLIIRSAEDLALDAQEVTVFLHDFSFKEPTELFRSLSGESVMAHGGTSLPGNFSRPSPASLTAASSSNPAALALCGDATLNTIDYDAYLANDRTLDDPLVIRTERGGRVRLRLINGASGTSFWIELGRVQGEVIAADGNPVRPVKGSRFPLAQGQRLDILVDVPAGVIVPVLAQREGERELTGIVLAAPGAAVAKLDKLASEKALPIDLSLEEKLEALTPLPTRKPNTRREISLAGTMTPFSWTINERAWAERKDIRMQHGQRVVMELRNNSLMAHAMHLHGHCFQVIGLEDRPLSGAVRDTVLVPALGTVTIAFDADNVGRWLFHCHNLWHMAAGMMTQLVYKYA